MSNKLVELSHDPFDRVSLVRRIVPHHEGGCAWCGGHNAKGTLFQYGSQRDDRPGKPVWDSAAFCSKRCRQSYVVG